MNELESLRRLTEAVETAKADIAPTYIEYVHLAFAIATDCGEEDATFPPLVPGFRQIPTRTRRTDILQRTHCQSWGYASGHGVLSRRSGRSYRPQRGGCKQPTGTKGTAGTAQNFPHTRARVIRYTIASPESEELLPGSEPKQPLPTFPAADWPELLQRIMSYGSTDAQNDVMLLGALTALGSCMERYVRCPYGGKLQSPACKVSL